MNFSEIRHDYIWGPAVENGANGGHDLLAAVDVDLDTAAVHEHAQAQQSSSCMGIGSTKGLIHPYMICRPFVLNDCGA